MENETETTQEQQPQTVNLHKFERMQDRAEKAEAELEGLRKQVEELTAKQGDDQTAYEAAVKALQEDAAKAATEAENRAKEYEAQIARDAKEKELLKAGCIDSELGVAALTDGKTVEQLKDEKPYLFKAETKPSSGDPKSATVDPEAEFAAQMRKALGLK